MEYNVKLDIFEGPFDLLLFLIQKNELDLFNIPISDITTQFVEYVESGKQINLEFAGEFIEMVAILLKIKTKMLLPIPVDEDGELGEDPRTELVRRLIEYKQYKEASEELSIMADNIEWNKPRSFFSYLKEIEKKSKMEEGDLLSELSLFHLIKSYKKILDDMPKIHEHHVETISVTVEEQEEKILKRLFSSPKLSFLKFMREATEKIVVVVSFIAILDLIRDQKIRIVQDTLFEDIIIEAVA